MKQYSNRDYEPGFQWGPFLLGVVYAILGIFIFMNPEASIFTAAYIVTFSALLSGLFDVFVRRKYRQHIGANQGLLVFNGILKIIIGIFLLFNIFTAVVALPFIFAFWMVLDSVGTVVTSGTIKKYSNGQFWFTLIVGIIGIIIGLYLIFNSLASYVVIATLLGVYFTLIGIMNILYAF